MKYKLQDLIDMEHFQNLQDRLNEVYSFPSAIIDNGGNILTATAWQDICTHFHRKNEDCERACLQSDQYILSHLHEANPAVSYRCPHGLVDNATPIIIDGIHYGNFFTGQFFLEKPDREFFRAQAKKYGFDEDAYLEAVKKVPIWTQEQLKSYVYFIQGLIAVISDSGQKKLREVEARTQIEHSEERHRAILQTAMDGVWSVNRQGRLLEVNAAYCRMSGYSAQELPGMHISDLEVAEGENNTAARIQKIIAQGEDRFESRHRRKDGSTFDVEVSVQYRPTDGGQMVAFLRDITERKQAENQLQETLESLRKAIGTTIRVMVAAVESRDPYTSGHQVRSADLARAIAMEMRLPQEKIEGIRMGGSIHDIGKLSIPAEILSKPTRLTDVEFALIKEHARKGFDMLKDVESPWPLAEIVHQHHERMDGSGYPGNLKGEEILMEARILTVADVVEAMASHRPYRAGLGIEAALHEIEHNRGIIYDPAVADACLTLFRDKGFQLEGI